MLDARTEDFQTLCLRTPPEDVYIDITHPPAFHLQATRLIQIYRIRPHERGSVVVDYVFLFCIDNAKVRPQRKTRPIGGGAHHAAAGQAEPECIVPSAPFAMRVSRRPHFLHTTSAGSGNQPRLTLLPTTAPKPFGHCC